MNKPKKSQTRNCVRQPYTIAMLPEVKGMGDYLAAEDKRNFSYELEFLIEAEFNRRQLKVVA